MAKDTKLIHFTIADGTPEQIKALSDELNKISEKLDFDIQFLVSNDKIAMRDVKTLIEELYHLYKQEKKLKQIKKKKNDGVVVGEKNGKTK